LVATAELAAVRIAVKVSPGISASKTPLRESYTRISDITVGRERAELTEFTLAILIETLLCPETYAGIKNIEAPPGTVSKTR
jgi:hypothetical protein